MSTYRLMARRTAREIPAHIDDQRPLRNSRRTLARSVEMRANDTGSEARAPTPPPSGERRASRGQAAPSRRSTRVRPVADATQDQMYPRLTPAEIARIAPLGEVRSFGPGVALRRGPRWGT
jgi:hypothetical protein